MEDPRTAFMGVISFAAANAAVSSDLVRLSANAYVASAHLSDEHAALDSVQKLPFRVTEGAPIPGYFGLPHSWSAATAGPAALAPPPPVAVIGPAS